MDRSFESNLPSQKSLSFDNIKNLSFDPVSSWQCGDYKTSSLLKELSEKVGGFNFEYILSSSQNIRNPILIKDFDEIGHTTFDDAIAMESAEIADAKAVPAVEIKRADLIGRHENKVFFLSKVYGLYYVTLGENNRPKISCYLLQPGRAKNFYIHNGMVVLLLNGIGSSQNGAIVRYRIDQDSLSIVDYQILENQKISDSRLFNNSLAVFATIEKHQSPNELELSTSFIYVEKPKNAILTVADLKPSSIDLKFEDVFINNEKIQDGSLEVKGENIGKIDWKKITYNSFISASDRYLVVSRRVNQRLITGVSASTHRYWVCKNYNPKWMEEKIEHCQGIWESTLNPLYDPSFACTDLANFSDCIKENESKFIKEVTTYKGKECKMQSYWIGKCLEKEEVESTDQYFDYDRQTKTELIIYRFGEDGFTRIGSVDENQETVSVAGYAKEHKSFYFNNDYFYVVTTVNANDSFWGAADNETVLHTFAVGESTLVKSHELGGLGLGERLRAVLFSKESLYLVTYRDVDPLYGIDLSIPAKPVLASELKIPGFSTQLILSEGKLIGIGRGDKGNREGRTSHVKLSLFDASNLNSIAEVDSMLLGEDGISSSNSVEHDDQLFHFYSAKTRLFMPYQVHLDSKVEFDEYVCRDRHYLTQHRIHISEYDSASIKFSKEFEVPTHIKRHIAIDDHNALAFGDTSLFQMKKEANDWFIETIKEEHRIDSLYRDASLPANSVVAKLTKRKGYQLSELRFAMGTPQQISKFEFQDSVEFPQSVLECLGEPQEINYIDNNVVVIYDFTRFENSSEVKFKTAFAWTFTPQGITQLGDEVALDLANERQKYCKFIKPLPMEKTQDQLENLLQTVKISQLECKDDKEVQYWGLKPLFCQEEKLLRFCPNSLKKSGFFQ